ncbi:hypothetical protein [Gemmata sp.]|uniref:hypothetical protein n=1 Tax=Gemmata sp. TaxID=1914242 RepID=UPI003F6E9A66
MSQIHADAEMVRQLEAASGPVTVVNDQGATIAVCMPIKSRSVSKYTPEEIERRRRDLQAVRDEVRKNPGSGRRLADILADLPRLAGDAP